MDIDQSDWWFYTPKYTFTITDVNGVQYELDTLASCQASLGTDSAAVGQGVFTFQDPDWDIWRGVKPRAMDYVQLTMENRRGGSATAWSGYVDRANKVDDPTTGQQLVLSCTSPQKLFEVKPQTPSQAFSLTLAVATGVTGSTILRYAASKVGFPASRLLVDSAADVAANTWGAISVGDISNPQSSAWSSVVQGLLADSGLESFFDEDGNLIWRPLAYLNVPTGNALRVLDLADVGHYDLEYSDSGVVTTVEVRYGATPFHVPPSAVQAAYWQAPPSMVAGLRGTRYYTVVAPYIGSNQNGVASYLAKAIGQASAAKVAAAVIVQVADPTLRLGTVVEIPSNDRREGPSLGYLSSKSLNLVYKGPWLEVLGFSYLRPKGQSFPYGLVPTVPVQPSGPNRFGTTANQGIVDVNLDLLEAANNSGRFQSSFNLVQDSSVAAGDATVDPSLGIPLGSQIQVWSSFTGHDRVAIGPRALYDVVSASGSDSAVHLSDTSGYTTGFIVLIASGNFVDGTSTSPSSGATPTTPTSPPAPATPASPPVPDPGNADGTNLRTPLPRFPRFPLVGYSYQGMLSAGLVTQGFGQTGNSLEPGGFHTGVDLVGLAVTPLVAVFDGKVTSVGWNQSVDAAASDGVDYSGLGRIYFGGTASTPHLSFPSSPGHLNPAGFGYNVSVRAGDVTVHYGHTVDGQCPLVAGQPVHPGSPLGFEDSTGNSTGAHLHFGVFDHKRGGWVNPKDWLL